MKTFDNSFTILEELRTGRSHRRQWSTRWIVTALALSLTGCAVEEITVTESSKGGLVTTTTRKSRKVDPAAWTFAEAAATAYAPHGVIIREK